MSRFQYVRDHKDAYGVKRLCQVLEVNRSSYYKWEAGKQVRVRREEADRALAAEIRTAHADSDGAYGSPRVTAQLRAEGRRVNEKRVARVMRKYGIEGIRLRRRVRTTVPEPSAVPVPDLFHRDFTAPAPGLKYMGDITYLPTGDGEFLYLATVLDCFSPSPLAPSRGRDRHRLPEALDHPPDPGRVRPAGLRPLPAPQRARHPHPQGTARQPPPSPASTVSAAPRSATACARAASRSAARPRQPGYD
ncbi:IS3 family transposase [Kitasatospora sp. NPDC101801]|uniref:IS3 family transposase n=1 Tax=Kitasatospora sp. NPDC101801 TaxID=3364103 RepID=UPI00381E3BC0